MQSSDPQTSPRTSPTLGHMPKHTHPQSSTQLCAHSILDLVDIVVVF
jgi:hypothetical protein